MMCYKPVLSLHYYYYYDPFFYYYYKTLVLLYIFYLFAGKTVSHVFFNASTCVYVCVSVCRCSCAQAYTCLCNIFFLLINQSNFDILSQSRILFYFLFYKLVRSCIRVLQVTCFVELIKYSNVKKMCYAYICHKPQVQITTHDFNMFSTHVVLSFNLVL